MRWGMVVMLAWVGVPAAAGQASAGQVEPGAAAAQTARPVMVELRLKDGSVIYGFIQSETTDRIVIKTIAGGIVEVDRAQVRSLRPARGEVVNGEFRPADANATRLMFGPTGRSLAKGEGYVGVYEFLLPFVQAGITDRFSMGAGTPLVFLGDATGRPVWVTPKYQFYKGARTSAAVGVMHFFVVGEDSRVGVAYLVSTTGPADHAVTVGLGWVYARYHDTRYDYVPCSGSTPVAAATCMVSHRTTETEGTPVFMVGGEHRVSRRVKVVTENYAFQSGGIVSVGVRFLGDRLSADLGLLAPVGAGEFVVGPVMNFVWTFGRSPTR